MKLVLGKCYPSINVHTNDSVERVCVIDVAPNNNELSLNHENYRKRCAKMIGEALLEKGVIRFDTSKIEILCDDEYRETERYRTEKKQIALRTSVYVIHLGA